MRWYVALVCIAACDSRHAPPASKTAESVGAHENAAPSVSVKRPVPTTPLPALAADAGKASGKPIWQSGFGGIGVDAPRGVAIGGGGDVYVSGYFDGETDFGGGIGKKAANGGSDAYVVKLGNDGKLAWALTFGSKRDDDAKAIAARGEIAVVVGNFTDELKIGEFSHKAAGSDDLFAVAIDKKGAPQWLWTLGGIDSDGANAVAASPDGGWVIGGSFTDSISFGKTLLKSKGKTDALLVKLSASGDMEWIKSFGGRYDDTIMHLAVDLHGNTYVQGHFADVADWGGTPLKAGGGSDNDVVLAKYDPNGDHVWSKNFGNGFNDVAGGVTVDRAGNVTIVGSFENKGPISFGEGDSHASLGESDVYIARFDRNGALLWARTFGAEREDIGWGVASDGAGNTIATGWFQRSVDFGKGPIASRGNKDVFAVKYDVKGQPLWIQTWGDRDHDQGRGVAIDDNSDAIVVSAFRFKLALVGTTLDCKRPENHAILTKAPQPDTAVVKLAR